MAGHTRRTAQAEVLGQIPKTRSLGRGLSMHQGGCRSSGLDLHGQMDTHEEHLQTLAKLVERRGKSVGFQAIEIRSRIHVLRHSSLPWAQTLFEGVNVEDRSRQ